MIFDSNELFPFLLLANEQASIVRYSALSDAKIYSVPHKKVKELIDSDAKITHSFLMLAFRLYYIQSERIVNLENTKAYDKVAYRLVTLAMRFGTKKQDGSMILDSVFTHKIIGETINLSRESVAREFSKLVGKGLVYRHEGKIIIPDLPRLSQIVKI